MTQRIRLALSRDDVVAEAKLLEHEAPETCTTLWEALPLSGELQHAIWSGPETYLLIDPSIRVPPENQITRAEAGDIAFYSVTGGRIVDWPDDIAELAFFYGRGAQPAMPTGPVAVNLFARIVDNLAGFAEACERMRREGIQELRVERTG